MGDSGVTAYLSHGSWRLHVALLALAGSRAAVLAEASRLGDVHPAVLTQRLATVGELR